MVWPHSRVGDAGDLAIMVEVTDQPRHHSAGQLLLVLHRQHWQDVFISGQISSDTLE